jgi:altronate hydrolase
VDGVHAFDHPYGCSQLGDDLANTQRILAGLVRHPNAGGVLLLGLGCENNRVKDLLAQAGAVDPQRVRTFNTQDVADEVEDGLAALEALAQVVSQDRRVPCPVADLVVAMKCGGSDGLSGLTANPLVGRVAEWICGAGGVPMLSEVPEMFGAERGLMSRASSEAVYRDVVKLIDGFKEYFVRHGQPVYENPSPGNKDGGITTLEEKSLGALQKGGRAPVRQVARYGAAIALAPEIRGGLALIDAPGNDAVSATAMVAAGAVMLFTTGRGTPLGAPVPTVKVSSNSGIAARKPAWIDFDAGRLLTGTSLAALTDELVTLVLDVASGRHRTRNEVNDVREIAVWKQGVTL